MKKYVIGAIVFAFVLIIGFFGFSLVKANINDRTILDEWRSWLPVEEKQEEIPEDVLVTPPVIDEPLEEVA